MPQHQVIALVLVLAGLADGVAALLLAKRLEGKPNREVALGAIGLTSVELLVVGALVASGTISLPG